MGTPPPKGKEVVCSNCGLVQRCDYVEDGGTDGDLARLLGTGVEQHLRHVDYLGSFIGYRESRCFRDGSRRALAPPLQDRFLHLKRVYNKGKSYGSYAHVRTLRSLIEVADGLSVCEDVKTQALYLYKKVLRKGFRHSGISTISMAVFCLLQANRSNGGRLVALKDIVEGFRARGHKIAPFDLMDAGLVYRQLLSEKPKLPVIEKLYEERNKLALIGVDLNSVHGVAVAHVSMTHAIEWRQVFKINNPLLSRDYARRIANLMRCGNRAVAGRMISESAESVRIQHYDVARRIVDKAMALKSEGLTPVIAIERLDYHSLVKSLGGIRSKRVRKAIASTVLSALDRLEQMALWHDIRVWKVSPWGTSKQCFRCHVKMDWGCARKLRCGRCGAIINRHTNAAMSIAWRAYERIKTVSNDGV